MLQYIKKLPDFWSQELERFKFTNCYSWGETRPYHHEGLRGQVSTVWQNWDDELPSCWRKFGHALGATQYAVAWTLVPPGRIIPIHKDLFVGLRDRFNVELDHCVRYLVMLQDWHFGQTIEFSDTILRRWRAGDVWCFDSTEFHWGANVSNYDFFSCQVSTVKSLD